MGGGICVRRDASALLRLTVDLGYQCKVCSNGVLLTRDRLQEIKEATRGRVTIALGLNAIDEGNTWSRNAGAERTLRVLEWCEELRLDRHVIITIGKHNAETFSQTVNYLVARRISFNRSPLVGQGDGNRLDRVKGKNGPPSKGLRLLHFPQYRAPSFPLLRESLFNR